MNWCVYHLIQTTFYPLHDTAAICITYLSSRTPFVLLKSLSRAPHKASNACILYGKKSKEERVTASEDHGSGL